MPRQPKPFDHAAFTKRNGPSVASWLGRAPSPPNFGHTRAVPDAYLAGLSQDQRDVVTDVCEARLSVCYLGPGGKSARFIQQSAERKAATHTDNHALSQVPAKARSLTPVGPTVAASTYLST